MRELHIAAAIVRRDGEVLMIRQAGPQGPLYWTVPGGVVEEREFVTDAVVREVREETGLAVVDPGTLAFIAQVDDRPDGSFVTLWMWDVADWEGEIGVADPDGLVFEAAWVPLHEAISRLESINWVEPVAGRYLRGKVEPGSLWLLRVHQDGRREWLASSA